MGSSFQISVLTLCESEHESWSLVSGLCPLGSAGFEDSVESITRGDGVAAVLFPREGSSTEEALFRGCMAGVARWVSRPFLHLQDLETGFLKKGPKRCAPIMLEWRCA